MVLVIKEVVVGGELLLFALLAIFTIAMVNHVDQDFKKQNLHLTSEPLNSHYRIWAISFQGIR